MKDDDRYYIVGYCTNCNTTNVRVPSKVGILADRAKVYDCDVCRCQTVKLHSK